MTDMPLGAYIHATERFQFWFGDLMTPVEYRDACQEIAGDTSAAVYMGPAKDGRQVWLVYIKARWVRAVYDPDGKCVVTFTRMCRRHRIQLANEFQS